MLADDKYLKTIAEMPKCSLDLVDVADLVFSGAVLMRLASFEDEVDTSFGPVAQGRIALWASIVLYTINVFRRGFVYNYSNTEVDRVSASKCRVIDLFARGALQKLKTASVVVELCGRTCSLSEAICQCPEFVMWVLFNLYDSDLDSQVFREAVFCRACSKIRKFWEVNEIDEAMPSDGEVWRLVGSIATAGEMAHAFYEDEYEYR